MAKKVNTLSLSLSLSFSPQICFSFGGFLYCFNHLFPQLMALNFVIIDLIVTLYLFLILENLYKIFMHIYVFWYSNSQSQVLFLYPISLI